MKKSMWIWIVCGALAAVVTGLIFWRVLTPPDRDFLQVCWVDVNGAVEARYLDINDGASGECPDQQTLVWNRSAFPLVVETTPSAKAINLVGQAIAEFNKQAGWTVFRPKLWNGDEDKSLADVLVNWSAPYGDSKQEQSPGSVSHTKQADQKLHADVNIRETNYPYVHAILLHELGHVVGLTHAPPEDRINIMEANLTNWQEDGVDMALGLRKLSPEDKELLETYK